MRNYVKYVRHLCVLTLCSSLLACATSGGVLVGQPLKTPLQQADKRATAQVVFFHDGRVDTDRSSAGAVVISTQGEVISGLHRQQYIILPACDGTQIYQVTRGDTAATSIKVNTAPNSVHYVRLKANNTTSAIEYTISEHHQVGDAIEGYDARSFLVPRHNPSCGTPGEPTTFNLDSKALFDFGGADLIDVLHSQPLEQVVHFIKENSEQPLRITVSGYTDHLGARIYNQKLSEERAQTVANYLRSRGYSGNLQVFGFGSADPAVTDCPSSLTRDELIECLQPNRRVTVRVWQGNGY